MNTPEASGEYTVNPDQSQIFRPKSPRTSPVKADEFLPSSVSETGVLLAGATLATAILRDNPKVVRRNLLKFGAGLTAVALESSTHVPLAKGAGLRSAPILAASFRDRIILDSNIPVRSIHYDPNLKAERDPVYRMAQASAVLGRSDEWPSINKGIFVPFSYGKYATDTSYGNCTGESAVAITLVNIPKSVTIGGQTFSRYQLECNAGLVCYGLSRGRDFLWGGEVQDYQRPWPMVLHHVLIQRMGSISLRKQLGLDPSVPFSGIVGNYSDNDDITWGRATFNGEMTRYNLTDGLTRVELRLRTSAYQETEPGLTYKDYNFVYVVKEGDLKYTGRYLEGFLRDFWPAGINWDNLAKTSDSPIITPDQMIQDPDHRVVRGMTADGKPITGILDKTGFVKTLLQAVGKLPR